MGCVIYIIFFFKPNVERNPFLRIELAGTPATISKGHPPPSLLTLFSLVSHPESGRCSSAEALRARRMEGALSMMDCRKLDRDVSPRAYILDSHGVDPNVWELFLFVTFILKLQNRVNL